MKYLFSAWRFVPRTTVGGFLYQIADPFLFALYVAATVFNLLVGNYWYAALWVPLGAFHLHSIMQDRKTAIRYWQEQSEADAFFYKLRRLAEVQDVSELTFTVRFED